MAGTGRTTRQIGIGGIKVGGGAPVVVQSMCATRTVDIDKTVAQAHQLARAGAGIVRIALDNEKEVPALKEIRAQTRGIMLSVDLQENYRIAGKVATARRQDSLQPRPSAPYRKSQDALRRR